MEFEGLQRSVFAAHTAGAYQQALELLDDAEPGLAGEHQGQVVHWRACFTSLTGRPAEALAVLRDGFDRGVWWDPQLLDRDPDLAAMRQLADYAPLRGRLLVHQQLVASTTAPELLVELPAHAVAEPCPVLLVLHGAWSSAARTRRDWTAALEAGWALALAQSSQAAGTDAFVWTDQQRALTELRGHVDTLRARGDVDVDRGVLCGFSQGAALALLAILTDQVPQTRFIAQAPSFETIRVDLDRVALDSRQQQLEGVFLVGTADFVHDGATAMATALSDQIGRCDLEVVDGLGHEAPADLPSRIQRWLAAWHPER